MLRQNGLCHYGQTEATDAVASPMGSGMRNNYHASAWLETARAATRQEQSHRNRHLGVVGKYPVAAILDSLTDKGAEFKRMLYMGHPATEAARKENRAPCGYQRQNGGKARKPVAE